MFQSTTNVYRRALTVTVLVAMSSSVSLGAAVHLAGVADFYQHAKGFQGVSNGNPMPVPPDARPAPLQPAYDNGNWWEKGGGWCLTTAWVNALYYWSNNGAPGLFDHSNHGGVHAGKTWQERFAYVNEDLAITAAKNITPVPASGGACAYTDDVKQYCAKWGYTATIEQYIFSVDANRIIKVANDGTATYMPFEATMLKLFADSITANKTPILYMQGITTAGSWWDGSFHAVTGEGVDLANSKVWFADPNDTPYGANWGVNYKGTDKVPVGADASFGSAKFREDGRTWADGAFAGTAITRLFVLSVPTPGTATLLTLAGVLAFARRRVPVAPVSDRC